MRNYVIQEAYEQIRAVLGVSNNVIFVRQVHEIVQRLGLDDDEQAVLEAMLAESGICPIPDEELSKADPKAPRRNECSPEERAARFESVLLACLQDLKGDLSLITDYRKEMPLLKKCIANAAENSRHLAPDLIVAKGVMVVAYHRIEDVRRTGWVCGYQANQARNLFHRNCLCRLFSSEELADLVRYCENPNVRRNPHLEEALVVLLHHIPNLVVLTTPMF